VERLSYLYTRAERLAGELDALELAPERIAGAASYRSTTAADIREFLIEFRSHLEHGSPNDRALAQDLGERCVETGSFLFAAGAPSADWRSWFSVAGLLSHLGNDLEYSLQLLAIARAITEASVVEDLLHADLKRYRGQAIRRAVLLPMDAPRPSGNPGVQPDPDYEALVAALDSDDDPGLRAAITRIVVFWLNETSYDEFEPGYAPVFELEINAVVASLAAQGRPMTFREPAVRRFLEAALD
jgi:hypothetical protein